LGEERYADKAGETEKHDDGNNGYADPAHAPRAAKIDRAQNPRFGVLRARSEAVDHSQILKLLNPDLMHHADSAGLSPGWFDAILPLPSWRPYIYQRHTNAFI
jgi:hypothetical protein